MSPVLRIATIDDVPAIRALLDQPAIGWNHPIADKLIDSNKLEHLLSAKVLTLLRTML
jgi:hypothetical protein